MTLQEFIWEKGIKECQALFGVAEVTIYKWRSGARRPRPDMARKIELETRGRVGLRDIYGGTQ